MRIHETKPGFDNIARDALGGGMPPMPGPTLSSDGGESSNLSGLKKLVLEILDKYGTQLSQTIIDQLTALANGDAQLEETARVRQKFGFETTPPPRTRTKHESAKFADSLR